MRVFSGFGFRVIERVVDSVRIPPEDILRQTSLSARAARPAVLSLLKQRGSARWLGMSIRNLLNHNNPGPIIGDIASPLFGRSNQMPGSPNGEGFSENAGNRRLELQLRFTY